MRYQYPFFSSLFHGIRHDTHMHCIRTSMICFRIHHALLSLSSPSLESACRSASFLSCSHLLFKFLCLPFQLFHFYLLLLNHYSFQSSYFYFSPIFIFCFFSSRLVLLDSVRCGGVLDYVPCPTVVCRTMPFPTTHST